MVLARTGAESLLGARTQARRRKDVDPLCFIIDRRTTSYPHRKVVRKADIGDLPADFNGTPDFEWTCWRHRCAGPRLLPNEYRIADWRVEKRRGPEHTFQRWCQKHMHTTYLSQMRALADASGTSARGPNPSHVLPFTVSVGAKSTDGLLLNNVSLCRAGLGLVD